MKESKQLTASKEIEVKIKLDTKNLEFFKKWLEENATYIGADLQEEYYLNPKDSSWFKVHPEGYIYALRYLRIRMSPLGDTICYKDWTPWSDAEITAPYCSEQEVGVTDGLVALELLKSLGYTKITAFKKRRQSFVYKNMEISIDSVDDLGVFIEFEVKEREYATEIEEYESLKSFIRSIGFSNYDIQKQGFIILLWNPNFNWN